MAEVTGSCMQTRRKKSAAERRQQKYRAEGRTIGRILRLCQELMGHRGGQPTVLMKAFARSLELEGQSHSQSAATQAANGSDFERSQRQAYLDSLPDLISFETDCPPVDLNAEPVWVPLDTVPSTMTALVGCSIRPRTSFFLDYQNPLCGKRCASLHKDFKGTICTKGAAHTDSDIFVDFVEEDLARHGHRFITIPEHQRYHFEIERQNGIRTNLPSPIAAQSF